MDTVSMVVLLLIMFMAWEQGIMWLFFGCILLFILVARNLAVILLTFATIGTLWYFNLVHQWFIGAAILMGLILWIAGRKGPVGGEDAYSPELMQLLGGYGGG